MGTFPPNPGLLAERYEIKRELGRGGMATVYLAHDVKHDAVVAIKVLPATLARELGTKRFENEIRIATRLQHPHILPILDSGVTADHLWYAMPYVEGESLRVQLNRERKLPAEDATRIAREIALALDYAHRKGVVHRDIKPENILLSDGQAIVADFGVALAIQPEHDRLTQTGFGVGTINYASPEQMCGERDLDGRADVYALGCVLYEMLAGECPFRGDGVQAVLTKKSNGTLTPPSALRRGLPAALDDAIRKALSPKPADRFATAHDFAEALATAGAPLGSTTPSWPRPLLRIRPAVVAAGVAIAAIATILIAKPRITTSTPADRHAVAVLPFQVKGSGLDLWREGLVSLFSANLDGAAHLRTLSDRTVLSRWQQTFGDANPEMAQAMRLAQKLGADQAITGSLVGSSAGVRLVGEIFRTSDDSLLSRTQVDGSPDSIPLLVDRMSVALLQSGTMGAAEGLSPKGVGELFTHSIPALKAYLAGEQQLRSFQPDRAIPSFEEAIRLDSTFALAFLRLGLAKGWLVSPHQLSPVPNDPLGKARRFADRLGTTEQLAIEGMWQAQNSFIEAIDTLRQLTLERPDDAQAWFLLGDALYHMSGPALVPPDSFRVALEKSTALDPGFGPAYLHLAEDAFGRGDSSAVRRYVDRLWAIDSSAPRAVGLSIARDVVWGDRRVRETALARLDTVTDDAAIAAKHAINWTVDLADETLAIIDRIVASPHHSDSAKAFAELGRSGVYAPLGLTRSSEEAIRRAARLRHFPEQVVAVFLAQRAVSEYLMDMGDSATAAAAARVLESMPDALYGCCADDVAWLWLRWGRTSVSPRERRIIDGRFAQDSVRHDTLAMRYDRASINFTHALESHNDSLILAEFPTIIRQAPTAIQGSRLPHYTAQYARLELARRLYARGKYADAEQWLLTFRDTWDSPPNTAVALWRGKVYEAMGDPKRAAGEYCKVAAWWANADSFLQPRRQEALAGLRRTGGAPSCRSRPISAGGVPVR